MSDERQVVVIGSGPAGAAAARELAEQGIRVTLLESGTALPAGVLLRLGRRNFFRRGPQAAEEGHHLVSGDPRTLCYVKLAPGGLSNCWTGAVLRFAPKDFTEGGRLHERYVWPVTYSDLAPHYDKVERYIGVSGNPHDVPQLPAGFVTYQEHLPKDWQDLAQAASRHGQGLTTYPLADGPPNMLVRRGTAFNSYTEIVRPLLRSPYFQLKTGAHALKLEWSAAKGRVDAVIYHNRATGGTERIEASAVIVACGPLGSAKLLHNSTSSDFPHGLGNSRGVLGCYLHDHPREWWSFEMERPRQILSPSAYLTRLPYDSSPPLLATSWTFGTASTTDRIRSRFGGKATSVGVQMIGTMIPTAECFAKPAAVQKDEFGLPALDVHIQYDDAEVQNVVAARQHLMNLLEESGSRATIGDIVPTLFPGTIAHYGGTARMHSNPEFGVTDAWNRVYDATNVLVCDASTFTTAAEKNPTLTLMALATRAAARLALDLKRA